LVDLRHPRALVPVDPRELVTVLTLDLSGGSEARDRCAVDLPHFAEPREANELRRPACRCGVRPQVGEGALAHVANVLANREPLGVARLRELLLASLLEALYLVELPPDEGEFVLGSTAGVVLRWKSGAACERDHGANPSGFGGRAATRALRRRRRGRLDLDLLLVHFLGLDFHDVVTFKGDGPSLGIRENDRVPLRAERPVDDRTEGDPLLARERDEVTAERQLHVVLVVDGNIERAELPAEEFLKRDERLRKSDRVRWLRVRGPGVVDDDGLRLLGGGHGFGSPRGGF
jgi:hypothetical protein